MSPIVFLIAALIGLGLGPLVFAALHRKPSWQLAVDGFVLVAVVGLVGFHVLPEAFEHARFWALLAAAGGLVLPLLVERVEALSSRASHGIVLAVAFSALLLHASLDGVGLGTTEGSTALALAIVLHRLPVGLAVWWLVRPQFGVGWSVAVLGALGLATVGGFAVQTAMVHPHGPEWVMLVQAFVAGSLLHVLLHQSIGFHDHAVESGWRIPGAIGGVLGFVVAAGLPLPGEEPFAARVGEVTFVSSPLILALFGLGLAILAIRRAGVERMLEVLDTAVPWTVAALVVGGMVAEDVVAPAGGFHLSAALVFGSLVVLVLAHCGPRDFLLEILPLDALAHGRHDDHAHGHDHSHGLAGAIEEEAVT